MNTPHATNRYLNLLVFFARTAPAEINAWRASLDQATAARLPRTYVAFVTFRSHQNPSQAPNHIDSCDNWALNYTMTPASGRWLINQVNPHPGVAEYLTCG